MPGLIGWLVRSALTVGQAVVGTVAIGDGARTRCIRARGRCPSRGCCEAPVASAPWPWQTATGSCNLGRLTQSGDQSTRSAEPIGDARGVATRQRIVVAAIEVASARGWDAATTRQIAERAGANQALIHYHFGSKERLLHVAFEAAMRDMFTGLTEALLGAPNLHEGVMLLIRALGQIDPADPAALFSMEALARSSRDAQLRASMAALLAEFRALVVARIEDEQARTALDPGLDPVGIATALAALFDGLGLHLLIDPAIDAERTAAAVSHLLVPATARAHRLKEPS